MVDKFLEGLVAIEAVTPAAVGLAERRPAEHALIHLVVAMDGVVGREALLDIVVPLYQLLGDAFDPLIDSLNTSGLVRCVARILGRRIAGGQAPG